MFTWCLSAAPTPLHPTTACPTLPPLAHAQQQPRLPTLAAPPLRPASAPADRQVEQLLVLQPGVCDLVQERRCVQVDPAVGPVEPVLQAELVYARAAAHHALGALKRDRVVGEVVGRADLRGADVRVEGGDRLLQVAAAGTLRASAGVAGGRSVPRRAAGGRPWVVDGRREQRKVNSSTAVLCMPHAARATDRDTMGGNRGGVC